MLARYVGVIRMGLVLLLGVLVIGCDALGPELGRERGQIGDSSAPLPTAADDKPTFAAGLTPFYYGNTSFAYDETVIQPLITTDLYVAQKSPVLDYFGEFEVFEGVPDFHLIHFHTDHTTERTTDLLILPYRDEAGNVYEGYDIALLDEWAALEARLEAGDDNRLFNEAKSELISFRNGQGVRRLMQGEMFGPEPITTENVFYQFDGFTDDGRLAIRFRYPVKFALAQPPMLLSEEVIEAAFNDYVNYATGQFDLIESLAMSEISPDFAALDQLIESLTVDVDITTMSLEDAVRPGDRYDYDLRDALYQTVWQVQWYALDPNSNADAAVGEAFLKQEVEIDTSLIEYEGESCPYNKFYYDYPDAATYLALEYQITAEYLEIESGFVEVVKNNCRLDGWNEMFKAQNSWDGDDVLITRRDGVFLYLTRKDGESFTLQPTNID